jgi:flagellar hook-associated protein 3 FlgL
MNVASTTAGSAWFLEGIANLQAEEAQTQRQLSSGYRVQDASDSPAQTPELIGLGASLATVEAYQTNLTRVQAEASSADQGLSSAITLIESATTDAAQGANTTTTTADQQNLAAQVQSLQQQLVSIANTSVEGRYIFGGDQDQTAPYTLATATGSAVLPVPANAATRMIVNPQGQTVYQALTAQQIFDPRDVNGNATASNAFAALTSLSADLTSGITANITNDITSLQSVSTWLNQQQADYGTQEQGMNNEQTSAANQVTALQAQIGNIRDTNMAQAATDLTTESTDQTAALSAEAEIPTKSLFDYLG